MDDQRDVDLFGDEAEGLFGEVYGQDGPDLFGTRPDELILPGEPTPVDDPEMDLPEDEMGEIPIDPEDADPVDADSDEADPQGDVVDAEPVGDAEPAVGVPPLAAPAQPAPAPVSRPETPLALYRRYRPDTFDQVIGQEHVTEPLQRALTNNRVNHAYLFSGPRGCGKTTSARILARCLNCEQGPTPTPCGQCQSCRDLARGGAGSIDVIEIDAASHGGVDEARDLRERAFFAPVHSRYKIYIIDEAHMVTPQGFNALLKVVEEPPPHVKFIFATTEPEKVIGTIRSRTHHYPFRLVPPRTLGAYLSELCDAEGVAVDPTVLPLVVRAGAGSVRDSLSVLDQLLGGAGAQGVTYTQAARLLGYTPDTLLDEIVDAFAAGDAQGVFASIDKVIEVGQDPRRFAEDLLRRLRDLIIVEAVPDALASGLVDVAGDQAERLTTQASGLGAGELTRAAEVIATGLTEMRGTTAPRLHLELMCARVLLPGADVDGRGIHARLDRLERRLQMAAGADTHAPRPEPPEAPVVPDAQVSRPAPDVQRVPSAPTPVQRPRPASAPEPHSAREHADTHEQRPTHGERPPYQQRPEPEQRPGRQQGPTTAPTSAPAPGSATATPQPPPAPGAPSAGGSDPAHLSTAEVRAGWPEVLEAVKNRRRVTWIILRENAQVHSFTEGVLTLALNNPGALDSFSRGGSEQIVREAVLEVLGVAPTIRAVAGGEGSDTSSGRPPFTQPPAPSGQDGAGRGAAGGISSTGAARSGAAAPGSSAPDFPAPGLPAPDVPAPDFPAPDVPAPRPPDPASPDPAAGAVAPPPPQDANRRAAAATASTYAQRARANIQATQTGPLDEEEPSESLDDLDLDAGATDADALLTQHLGAQLIGEVEPDA